MSTHVFAFMSARLCACVLVSHSAQDKQACVITYVWARTE